MKYWRGYLVAAILTAFTLGLQQFAKAHSKLVDMVYPYITRLVQNYMAQWSSGVSFCLWQAILLALIAVAVASIVLMIVFRWNPIQWFGWVAAAVALIVLLNTGIFGMNAYAGPIDEDIRLTDTNCDQAAIEAAAVYYRDMANALADQVARSSDGSMNASALSQLNQQAEDGFKDLVYHQYYSVFAGTTLPVKELSMANYFTKRGQMGYTVAITGEAAVNPEVPGVMLPFAVCREMCYRMCIASQRDNHFGAFLACQANASAEFQYAAYVMAYRYCLNVLPQITVSELNTQADARVREDVTAWDNFVAPAQKLAAEKAGKDGKKDTTDLEIAELLTRWHYQEVVLPSITEPEVEFDPMDETQVDLTGLPHVTVPTEEAA